MTRASAKRQLTGTGIFKQVGGSIVLREVGLIEAVRDHGERWRLQLKLPRLVAWYKRSES